MAYDIFDLRGTTAQKAIILDALKNSTFPWERLKPKLRSTKNKTKIPVEWADLSAYAAAASLESKDDHSDHEHDHDETATGAFQHYDIELDGDTAHGVAFRSQILGLAWYSGKVSMDISLVKNPALAKEVFLSEGAHMVDFFYMTDKQRTDIFNAFHGTTDTPTEHGHDWFDKGDYYTWVGEAFMGGFVKAYSSFPVTIDFTHAPTPYVAQRIREILTPEQAEPKPLPSTPVAPTPEPTTDGPYVSTKGSPYFHRNHRGLRGTITYASRAEAIAARKRPCFVCKS